MLHLPGERPRFQTKSWTFGPPPLWIAPKGQNSENQTVLTSTGRTLIKKLRGALVLAGELSEINTAPPFEPTATGHHTTSFGDPPHV